jgi:hypothetical protein
MDGVKVYDGCRTGWGSIVGFRWSGTDCSNRGPGALDAPVKSDGAALSA